MEIKSPKRWGELSPGSYFTEKRERERERDVLLQNTGQNWREHLGAKIRVNLSLSKPCPSV